MNIFVSTLKNFALTQDNGGKNMSKKTVRYAALIFLIISLFSAFFVFNACSGEKHTHELVKTERKEPTCTEAGNIEYWFCAECGKYFSDEKGKTEVTDVVLPAKGHTFEGKICTVCGAEKPSDGLKLVLSDDGKSYVVSGIGTCTDTDIVIPDTYEGLPVTSIGSKAFSGCKSLTSITIPDTVTNIGTGAFENCSSLEYNNFDNAKYLGNDNNPYLVLVEASSKNISSCNVNENTRFILDNAFFYHSSLESITISDSVTSIGDSAFQYCFSLASISIPDSVTNIGAGAFEFCNSLELNNFDNAQYLGNDNNPYVVLLKTTSSDILSCEIHENTRIIYCNAFYECRFLRNLTVPDGVTNIGESAFEGCNSLTDLIIPDSLTSIGVFAFKGCGSLTDITIPDGVTSLGFGAFNYCSSLKSIKLPNNLIRIASQTFSECYSMTSITIPDSVTSIGDSAFAGCTSLENIAIPNGVTSIGSSTFYGCSSLTSITIPDSVTSIGERAFSGCTSLTSITIPDSVTSIGEEAFYYCTSLTSITIPDSVTSIGEYAFSDCTSLTSITIPDSVTSIGERAFSGCTSLTSITIPDSVKSIGKDAFSGCTALTSAVFENTTGWRVDNYNVVVTNPIVNAENLVSLSGTWTRIE